MAVVRRLQATFRATFRATLLYRNAAAEYRQALRSPRCRFHPDPSIEEALETPLPRAQPSSGRVACAQGYMKLGRPD